MPLMMTLKKHLNIYVYHAKTAQVNVHKSMAPIMLIAKMDLKFPKIMSINTKSIFKVWTKSNSVNMVMIMNTNQLQDKLINQLKITYYMLLNHICLAHNLWTKIVYKTK